MKTNNLIYIIPIFCIIISSCSIDTIRIDSNEIVTSREIYYSDYNTLKIANDFNAYVRFSETEEHIEIEANDNLHEFIVVSKNENTLTVGLKNNVNIKGQATLNVYITTKSIASFKAVADSKILLETPLENDNVKIVLSADSYFSGELNVNHLDLSLSADSRANLYGNVNHLDADLTADSRVSDYDLEVSDLKIKMSADCRADLTVTNTIDIDAVADSSLYYKGDAVVISQNLRADSRIVKVD